MTDLAWKPTINIDEIIGPAKYHRSLDGFKLASARQEAGLTQEEFATKCGWSQTYQVQLEHCEAGEVRLKVAETITRALSAGSKAV